jgi:anti-sigma regulatory factor (Ser/Thr protein kinase)
MTSDGIRASIVHEPDHAVVTLDGELRGGTVAEVRGTLEKAFADRSRVIVDLGLVQPAWQPAVGVFRTVHAAAGGWPACRLVLFGATPGMAAALRAARVPRSVPLVADRDAAERELCRRPEHVLREMRFPAQRDAAAAARSAARQACLDWGVEHRADDVATVAGEFVQNAVSHGRSDAEVSLALDDSGFWVEVRDLGPGGKPRAQQSAAGTGRGLALVDSLVRYWGVTPHQTGKSVWALLPLEPDA